MTQTTTNKSTSQQAPAGDTQAGDTQAGDTQAGGTQAGSRSAHQPPAQPENTFRIALELASGGHRIDAVLLEELRKQDRNPALKNISRTALKKLFKERKILIKGQSAVPSSGLAKGITFVDILGFAL